MRVEKLKIYRNFFTQIRQHRRKKKFPKSARLKIAAHKFRSQNPFQPKTEKCSVQSLFLNLVANLKWDAPTNIKIFEHKLNQMFTSPLYYFFLFLSFIFILLRLNLVLQHFFLSFSVLNILIMRVFD